MAIFRMSWIVLLALVCVGCGDSGPPAQPPVAPAIIQAILQDLASRGEMNSGVDELAQQFEAMKATDPAKAKALLADYQELRTLSNPQAIKTKAKAMLEKL